MQVCMHITSRRRRRMKMHMKTTSQSHHSIFRQTLLFPPVFSGLIIFSGLMFHFSTFCYISHHALPLPPAEIIRREKVAFAVGEAERGCDVYSGRWVWDHLHRPLYEESECPYIDPQLTCREHGRPDTDYQRWRWQPHGCSLPSFNATLILESLRDKRMVFVGDSVNRGQFVSMVCLLHKMIPKSMTKNGSQNVFMAKDYNATIEFEWAPFLLESNKNIKNWKGVDIMVFNIHTRLKFNTPLERGLEEEGKDRVLMPAEEFYGMAIKNMIQWVNHNMDPNKTRLFFTSISPSHTRSVRWGGDRKGNCYNEMSTIQDPNYWGLDSSKINNIMSMMGEVLTKSKVPITFLNITQLSSYRKDAHTSIYKKQRRAWTPEHIANPASYADCVHWCLPGLQDTWNELLFAKLFYP